MFQSREMYYKYHKKTTTPELKNTWISIKTKYTEKNSNKYAYMYILSSFKIIGLSTGILKSC